MVSKIVLSLCVILAVASAVPATPGAGGWGADGVNPWIPPWVASAPWMPQWVSCTAIGSSCIDCNTKMVCTKVGGIQKACTDPSLPYCNAGACSATPSAECSTTSPDTTV